MVTGGVDVSLPYLQRLLAYAEAENVDENSEWHGSWTVAIREIQRLTTRSIEETELLWGCGPR